MAVIVSPSPKGQIPNGIPSQMNSKSFTTSTVKEVATQGHKEDPSIPRTIDELLRSRAETHPNSALLAYPKSSRGVADFVTYTARDLDRFAEAVARKLQKNGLRAAVRSTKSLLKMGVY
jgi:hypothetical protein